MTQEIIDVPDPVGPDEPGFGYYLWRLKVATNFKRATWLQTPESKEKYKPNQIDPKTGKRICGALCVSLKDEPCQRPPMANGRCAVHGGKAPRGATHYKYLTGDVKRSAKRAKYLPVRLRERYEEALTDDELLSMRANTALLEARAADLLKRIDNGESGELWLKLLKLRNEAIELGQLGLRAESSVKVEEMFRVIGKGAGDTLAWNELYDVMERQRKQAESEQKRLTSMQQMITVEQAMTLVMAMTATLRMMVERESDAGLIEPDVSTRIIRGVGQHLAELLDQSDKRRLTVNQ